MRNFESKPLKGRETYKKWARWQAITKLIFKELDVQMELK
jgi:hypothetical protein